MITTMSQAIDASEKVSTSQMDNQSECMVYIVDDDASVRKSLGWLLESASYQTQSFSSAQEFLDHYEDKRPGCLLLDVRMPGASGFDLQSMLDSRKVKLPIIFISGHVDVQAASKAFRAGACDVLTKPVDVDVLLERVQESLAKDRQRREALERSEAKRQKLNKLTPKESEVYQSLLVGRTIKQLAAEFEVSFQTAAKHRARVLEKLGVDTDAQLIHAYQEID